MKIDVLTLFPEMVEQVRHFGVIERAHKAGLFELTSWNPRDYTRDVHRTVDDRPYGGGPGMVMKYEPLAAALADAKQADPRPAKVIHFSPQGEMLNQSMIERLSPEKHLILVAGRYEGIDERFIDTHVDIEISLGDFVLSGGELAAMALIDALVRQIPGTVGTSESIEQDSFMNGCLDHPHYTRPEIVDDLVVPPVLTGGNHKAIKQWRRQQALLRTWQRRPDLFAKLELTPAEKAWLKQQ